MNGNAHSFLFADLVGFTALTAAEGDETAAELAVEFADSVRALAAEHGVEFVKAMGDAVMVRGASAAQTVALGLRLVHDGPTPAWRPPVRIGVHTGTAVSRDGDWYGTTVNVAARLAACAAGRRAADHRGHRPAHAPPPAPRADRPGPAPPARRAVAGARVRSAPGRRRRAGAAEAVAAAA